MGLTHFREFLYLSCSSIRHHPRIPVPRHRIPSEPLIPSDAFAQPLGESSKIFDLAPVERRRDEEDKNRMIDFESHFGSSSKGLPKRASLKLLILMSATAWLILLSSSTRATDLTLADLLAGGEITSGDKRFYGFDNYFQDGDLIIDAASIDVYAISSVGPSGIEYGIRFQTQAGWELNGPNKNYDMSLDFLVQATAPGWSISDNTLEFTGNHVGGGEAHLVEGVVDYRTNDTLANKQVYINVGNTGIDKLVDHQLFAHTSKIIRISKDFQLQTRVGANDHIFVSHFDQTFSQVHVPEPGTVILTLLGGVVLVGFRRLKSRGRQVDSFLGSSGNFVGNSSRHQFQLAAIEQYPLAVTCEVP